MHGAGRDFVGPVGRAQGWTRGQGGRVFGEARNSQEGRVGHFALRLKYCPELGSGPADKIFMVLSHQSCLIF